MSGLDGLGWPNPDDVERERDEIRAQLRAQLREEQQLHVQTLNERDEARGQLAGIENKMRGE